MEMKDKGNVDRSYRAMVGEPLLVVPAWPRRQSQLQPVPAYRPPAAQTVEGIHSPQSELDFLWDMARDAVEDIATLRSHRAPEPHETWRDPDRAEQRLLNQIDAAVNCGPDAAARLFETAEQLETPDPDWMYAVGLVMGCLNDEEALRRVLILLRISAKRDPEERQAIVEALYLSPNPDIGRVLVPLLSDASPSLREAAVQVLAYRRQLPADLALRSLRDSAPEVVAAAAEAFLSMDAAPALPSMRALLSHSDDRVVRSSLRVLFKSGAPEGRLRALSLCAGQPEYADACLILGLSGVQADFEVLERLVRKAPSPMAARAAGCFGDIRIIPRLIELLGEDTLKAPAAEALYRITGARLAQEQSGLGSVFATDPAVWTSWWDANRSRLSTDLRYRLGRPHGPSALLAELENNGDAAERLRAYLELGRFIGPAPPPFHPFDFIARQDDSLKNLRRWVETNSNLDKGKWWAR